jgi:hypothetical protein
MRSHALAVVLGAGVFAVSALSHAQDYVPVHEAAVGATEQQAVREAYYAALERALLKVAGYQADGDVGARFRRDFDANFDGFASRYFTPDTDHRCSRQQSGRYLREVEGSLKSAALQMDVRRLMVAVDRRPAGQLTFALSPQAKDSRKQFVIDKLSGAFSSVGHSLLVDAGPVNVALAHKQVDFALGIYEVTFSNLDDPAAYDPYELRLSGSLTVRFRLTDARTGRAVATVPVVVTGSAAGPYPPTLKDTLKQDLARRAAEEIARNVNAAVVSYQTEREPEARIR